MNGIDVTARGGNTQGRRASGPRRSRVLAVVAAAAAVLAGLVTAPGASAAPAPDPVTASVQQIDEVTYPLLFRTGLQIYEVAAVRPVENLYPPGNEMVLRRLHAADEGVPGVPRFAYVGKPLPEAFVVAEAYELPGVPTGLIMPADPVTLEEQPSDENLTMVSALYGPVGPFDGAGVSTPYLG